MAESLGVDEFNRYVQQHDDRQDRFFIEHNGALARIEVQLKGTNKMVREYNAQIAVLLEREVENRLSCAVEHNTRLGSLETKVGINTMKLKIPGWGWKAMLGVALFTSTILNIVLAVKVL